MKPRPDSPAILGLIAVAALIVVGWVVLTVAGKSTPAEPVVQDRAEREAISEFLADPPQPELADDADR